MKRRHWPFRGSHCCPGFSLLSSSCPSSPLVLCSSSLCPFYLFVLSSFPLSLLLSVFSFLLSARNQRKVIAVYVDNLFSSLSEDNYSLHTVYALSLTHICTRLHTHTAASLCAHTVCVYFHCHPQLIALPSPHPAIQGGRKAMVQSRTMAACAVQWSRLSVWGLSLSHLLPVWPADRDWWCNRATSGSTLRCDLSVSSALANGCSAVICHRMGQREMWMIRRRHESIYACGAEGIFTLIKTLFTGLKSGEIVRLVAKRSSRLNLITDYEKHGLVV